MRKVYRRGALNYAMRKLTPLLLLAALPAFAATSKLTLGARSAAHELRIERSVVAADRIAYNVVITDTASGATLLSSTTEGKPGEAVDVASISGSQHVRVRLSYTTNFFSATVNVTEGATILDEFRTWWQIEPRKPGAAVMPAAAPAQNVDGMPPLRVGGDVKAPVVLYRVEPIYSADARANRVSGIVILEAVIGKDGLVKNVRVLKPLPFGLDQAAVDAVQQWQFKPGTLNGEPVDVIFNLTVNFKLDTPPPQPE
jgi:TonB family protein